MNKQVLRILEIYIYIYKILGQNTHHKSPKPIAVSMQ